MGESDLKRFLGGKERVERVAPPPRIFPELDKVRLIPRVDELRRNDLLPTAARRWPRIACTSAPPLHSCSDRHVMLPNCSGSSLYQGDRLQSSAHRLTAFAGTITPLACTSSLRD